MPLSNFDRIGIGLLVAYGGVTAAVYAKLPAPSEEQKASVAARKAAEAKETEEQAKALDRVQDDTARRYAKATGRPIHLNVAPSGAHGVSRAATQPVQGPHGGDEKSAEAHSANAESGARPNAATKSR